MQTNTYTESQKRDAEKLMDVIKGVSPHCQSERRRRQREVKEGSMKEINRNHLVEAIDAIAMASKNYCMFLSVYMKQQVDEPTGIKVSPWEFQDGFRALNHASVAMERVCRVLTQTEPGKEEDQSFSHSDRSDGPSSEQSSHSKQPVE